MTHAIVADDRHPPTRLGCQTAVIRTDTGAILTLETAHKEKPTLPGGARRSGERIEDAAARWLLAETGLRRSLTHIIAVDQMPANPELGAADGVNLVFDGGTLTGAEADALSIPVNADGVVAFVWVRPSELHTVLAPYQARRIAMALNSLHHGTELPALDQGEPPVFVTGLAG